MRVGKILLLASLIFLFACEEQSIKSQQTQTATSDDAVATEQTSWAWPGVSEAGAKVDNLMADNYELLVDGSGSMDDATCYNSRLKKRVAGLVAIKEFIDMVPADANVGLTVFDRSGINERVPLATGNRAELKEALDNISWGSSTPLSAGIKAAYEALTKQAQAQLGYGKYVMVILADGQADTGYDPTRVVNEIVDMTRVEIHTAGFCLNDDHPLNQVGRTFYTPANDPASLAEAFENVLAEATADVVGTFGQ